MDIKRLVMYLGCRVVNLGELYIYLFHTWLRVCFTIVRFVNAHKEISSVGISISSEFPTQSGKAI